MPQVEKQTMKGSNNGPPTPKAPAGSVLSRGVSLQELPVGPLKLMVYGNNRVGKCLGKGTKVLMFDGRIRNVEDIQVGELLMGPDSTPRTVLSTATGEGRLYRITPKKGESWVCNDVHMMTVVGCNGTPVEGQIKDIELCEYILDIKNKVPHSTLWRLVRRSVEFSNSTELPVDPYLVGLWMGDGSIGTSHLTNNREMIQRYCQDIAESCGMICRLTQDGRKDKPTTRISFVTKLGSGGVVPGGNRFLNLFRDRCSVGGVKVIPHEYLTASRADRMRLLAGILDTDGDDTGRAVTAVTVTGEPYKNSLLFLCRSLGLAAYCGKSKTHICSSGKVSTYYRITISGALDSVPTKIKVFPPRQRTNRVNVTGFSAKCVGRGEYFGFELDGDGRFLLGDFTVTHNTTLACQFEKPMLLISYEIGVNGGTNSVRSTKGITFFRVVPDTSPFLAKRKPGEPYISLDESITLARELERSPNTYKWIVLDGATSCQDVVLCNILNLSAVPDQKSWGTTRDGMYVERSEKLRAVLRPYIDLPVNLMLLAKEKDHNPPKEERVNPRTGKVQPDMRPKFLRGTNEASFIAAELGGGSVSWIQDAMTWFGRLFIEEEVIEKEVKAAGQTKVVQEVTGEYIRYLRTKYHPNCAAGGQIELHEKIPEVMPNPTAAKILAMLGRE